MEERNVTNTKRFKIVLNSKNKIEEKYDVPNPSPNRKMSSYFYYFVGVLVASVFKKNDAGEKKKEVIFGSRKRRIFPPKNKRNAIRKVEKLIY